MLLHKFNIFFANVCEKWKRLRKRLRKKNYYFIFFITKYSLISQYKQKALSFSFLKEIKQQRF